MTEDEIRVLNYVGAQIGGPESIVKRLRPTYHSLIERGYIGTHYVLTDAGRRELEATQSIG